LFHITAQSRWENAFVIQTSFSHFVLGLRTFAEHLRKKPVEMVITVCTVPQPPTRSGTAVPRSLFYS